MPEPSAVVPTAADPIAAAAFAVLDRRLEQGAAAPVALALSGGGDSLVLLQAAAAWCAESRRPLVALTVDHALHPDSARWTREAGEAARAAGADWRALRWEGEKPRSGLPAAARAARHRLLAEAAREAGARVILTGHTLDDVLEGEAMRALDAPTLGYLREWSPSPVWPEGRGVFLLRPLLEVRRADLRDWLRARGFTWLDDPANEDQRFARARARLLPLREKVSPEATDEGCRLDVNRSLSHPSSGLSEATFSRKGRRDGCIVLERDSLTAPLLAAALLCAAGTDRPPRGERLSALLKKLRSGGSVQATLAGARVVAEGATVEVGREPTRIGLPTLPLDGSIIWDGRFEVRADEPGWSVAPLAGRIARLPRSDREALAAVPAWGRGVLPALVRGKEVRLPRPLGDGPAFAQSLAGVRLAGACGLIARESEIGLAAHGAEALITLCSGPSD